MKTIFILHNYVLLQQLYLPFKILHISTSKSNQSSTKKKAVKYIEFSFLWKRL